MTTPTVAERAWNTLLVRGTLAGRQLKRGTKPTNAIPQSPDSFERY